MIGPADGVETRPRPHLVQHRILTLLVVAGYASACGVPLVNLPAGPGVLAPDISRVVAEATSSCRGLSTYSADLSVRGSVGGRRIPRIRLLVGLAAPAASYLEAVASVGEPFFIYAAHDDRATLLLPRDDRVLADGDPAAVLEAVTGIRLGASELRTTMTGCMTDEPATGVSLGDRWRRASAEATDFYLRREMPDGGWRMVAAVHRQDGRAEWRSEYQDFVRGLPTAIRLVSQDANRFDLRLALSGIDVNQPIQASVFDLAIPPSMLSITIDELRRSGPLSLDARDDGH